MIVAFSRSFAMPNRDTFSVRPIGDFVRRHIATAKVSVDPFARNSDLATYRNDINAGTAADYHMDAEAFCLMLVGNGVRADLAIFDPPYSPRQISECYKIAGRNVTAQDTQNAVLYRRVRDALDKLLSPGGVCLSFGWNSNGMGLKRGYRLTEIALVSHGGAHNDTICIAEQKQSEPRHDES